MAVKVEEAFDLIYKNVSGGFLKIVPLEQALGFILAKDLFATHNLPPYDNSAMDGYAAKISDSGSCVVVNHTIFAGDNSDKELSAGFAIKIMTGAKIPLATQCIVPNEDVIACQMGVKLPDNLVISKHIRLLGEDIKSGDLLLKTGTKLGAYQIALLASQGISHVQVYKKPKVALFASGSELKMHFETIEPFQLYNTNTPTFFARAQELGCEVEFIGTAHDSLEDIRKHIKSALTCDLIVTSGGVSVGDADYTKEAFAPFGYEIFFDKIDIKPGKPTTFGRIENTYVLNLPGNPLAAALNFELFGSSIILALSGDTSKYLHFIKAKMKEEYLIKAGKRTLVPGFFDGEYFTPCEKFAPGMIMPLATSNAFIMIDEACSSLACGSYVKVLSTRFSFTSLKRVSLVSN